MATITLKYDARNPLVIKALRLEKPNFHNRR